MPVVRRVSHCLDSTGGLNYLRDVNGYTKAKSTLEPVSVYRGHTSVVGDVSWHATKENIFASVGDDRMVCM